MAPNSVLRFARSDDESGFVLLQVTSKGSRPLDLKLVGTEGEAPYVASCKSSHIPSSRDARLNPVKHDRVSSLRVKNCPASEPEWQAILESLFNQKPLSDIQATATVQSESSISITVRKETQGITQRLGAITLSHDADEAIELFEWCGAAVEASVDAKRAAADLSIKSNESEAAVAQLKLQLEELLQAKEEDETALLRKFRDLLNEKKVKIREQHQVLASGSFNASHPGSSTQSQRIASPPPPPSKPAKPSRKAGQSRATKRKQPASKRIEESEDEASPEAMDIDIKKEPEDTDPGETSEATASVASDDDDDDDDDEDVDDAPPAGSNETGKSLPKKTEQPPPKRSLPFNNKPATSKPAPAAPAGSETESDDEL